jgi:hypothetical protein
VGLRPAVRWLSPPLRVMTQDGVNFGLREADGRQLRMEGRRSSRDTWWDFDLYLVQACASAAGTGFLAAKATSTAPLVEVVAQKPPTPPCRRATATEPNAT